MPPAPFSSSGWTILVHPPFLSQIAALVENVQKARLKNPATFRDKNATKRLAAILKLAFDVIPQDPMAPAYLQGNTLGHEYRHWRRARFFQQYRLFFRCDQQAKIIVYAWVNDERTKRAHDSRTDAYAVFRNMLLSDNPPDDWGALVRACDAAAATLVDTARRSV